MQRPWLLLVESQKGLRRENVLLSLGVDLGVVGEDDDELVGGGDGSLVLGLAGKPVRNRPSNSNRAMGRTW